MEKKQTILKIITILIVITIAILFVVFYNFKPKNNEVIASPNNPVQPDTNIDIEDSNKPKIEYTNFPKKASAYKENGKIINIGGTNNDKILKNFVLNDEIILIVETSSNNNDFNAINKNIAISILNKDIDLVKTKVLEKTENLIFNDATIFIDGILLAASDENSTKLLLYDGEYNLINSIQIDRIDSGKFYHNGINIKLISTKKDELSYRMINESLNITAYTKCKNSGIIYDLINYYNYDIVITKNDEYFSILKIYQNKDTDNIYYLIDNICNINGLLCNYMIDKSNQNNLILNYIINNKICINTLNITSKLQETYSTEIASNNSFLIPLEYGYILHNYLDNTSNILDNNFNIIISNISMCTNDKSIDSYYFPFCKRYLFQSELNQDNITNICYIDQNFQAQKILSLPKINSKIDIKISDDIIYYFITTNNNIQEFENCYGGYDIFVIMQKKQK